MGSLWMRSMAACVVSVGLCGSAIGAEPTDSARTTIVVRSAQDLLDDIKYVLDLTNVRDQKQWPVIESYFNDVFLLGVDRTQPVRGDMLSDGEKIRYVWHFPVTKIKDFLENLDLFDLANKPVAKKPGLYELTDPQSNKYYLWFQKAINYASLAETVGDIPPEMPDPRTGIEHLLANEQDLAADMRNPASGVEDRHKAFESTREETLAALKKAEDETDDEFALRKLMTEQQLEEGARFYAEASDAQLAATLDSKKQEVRFAVDLGGIPDTDLAKSIASLGAEPSHFARHPRDANSILDGHIVFPLDSLRKKHLTAINKQLGDTIRRDIAAAEHLTAPQKEARQKAFEMFFALLQGGIDGGIIDGFIKGHPSASGSNSLLGGIRAPNGHGLIDVLKLLEDANIGRDVTIDGDKVGSVRIHRFTLNEDKTSFFTAFFGADATVFIGTEDKAVWYAVGDNALEELKSAISGNAAGAEKGGPEGSNFFSGYAKLGPWAEKLQAYRAEKGNGAKYRKMAVAALKPGNDVVEMRLDRSGERVAGGMRAEVGILRFIGTVVADFSRENLDEE